MFFHPGRISSVNKKGPEALGTAWVGQGPVRTGRGALEGSTEFLEGGDGSHRPALGDPLGHAGAAPVSAAFREARGGMSLLGTTPAWRQAGPRLSSATSQPLGFGPPRLTPSSATQR